MRVLLQQLLNGLSVGSTYALVAVGLSLILGVLQLINFAHGEFYMLGGYALLIFYKWIGVPYLPAVLLNVVTLAVVGWILNRVLRFHPKKPFETMILSTLGISVALQNGAIAIWGASPRATSTVYSRTVRQIWGISISDQRLLILIVALISFAALEWFIRSTKLGKAMRAIAQNLEAADVVGIDTDRVCSLTFAFGTGLAGLAAAVVSPVFLVYPRIGVNVMLKSFAAIIMGGRGNVVGAIVSALIIGVAECVAVQYTSVALQNAIGFVLLLFVLLVKPQGLFGTKAGLVR